LATWTRRILLGLVVLIVAARVAAPYVIKRVVNDKLAHLEGYRGHVEDVDLSLWRGAYQAEDLVIEKTDGKVPVPFIALDRLDLGVEWPALLDGNVVARVSVIRPQINFVKGPTKATTQAGDENDWQETVKGLAPIRINKFKVVDGEVHYRDFHSSPRVDVILDHLNVTASNLSNSADAGGARPSPVTVNGTLMHSGRLSLEGDLDPFAKRPTFELSTRLEKLHLTQLNPFLRAYVNVDVNRGTFSVYSELHSKDGNFKGFVKPMMEHLDVLQWKKEDERPIDKLWEALVGGVAAVLKNQSKDRLATVIPLSGQIDDPDVHAWNAALSLLRNGFIEALRHDLTSQ